MKSITGYQLNAELKKALFLTVTLSACFILLSFITDISLGYSLFLSTFFSFSITALVLKKSFERYINVLQGILNSINGAVVVKNYDGDIIYSNDIAKANLTAESNNTTNSIAQNKKIMDDHEEGKKYKIKYNRYHKAKELSLKVPFKGMDEKLKIFEFNREIKDISFLKNTSHLEKIFEISEEGLWEWNKVTNEVFHNKQWSIITGVTTSENTFSEFISCIFEDDIAIVTSAINDMLEHGKIYNVKFRVKKASGEITWVWDRGRIAEYDQDGKPMYIVGIILDITTEKRNQLEVERLAYSDPLTGLANRTQLETMLEDVISSRKNEHYYHAVLFIDLNKFKMLNDSYGHHIGDKLLKLFSDRILDCIPKQHIFSRLGGDEFIIIYPRVEQKEKEALSVALDYSKNIIEKTSTPFLLTNDLNKETIDYDVSISIGGIVFNSQEVTPGYILQLADIAMYKSKSEGNYEPKIFSLSRHEELTQSNTLALEIKSSLKEGNFCIYLQPKVDRNGTTLGAEALVRWHHPTRGLLSPADFLEQAEENNLIIEIGQTVLEKACEMLQKWQSHAAFSELTIAVNLSARQIWQKDFIDKIMHTINSHGINTKKLTLEVTESILIEDIKGTIEKLNYLKSLGISISLDDFGTGYSSLNYLHQFPIDEIKIDKSFVSDITSNKNTAIITRSIIGLAQSFNLNIVAEGVENKEELSFLSQHGVSIFQGYYFSRPLSIEHFEHKLNKREHLVGTST
ncbi:GGDEF and EAL domain-containing protein [Marinomonas algarum]|uniref:GGDEF and EAL domain-containing protein n=1 Tax=Marinomonas algarum TaxID=2883105 RepID=A0A9X1IPD7_9GAMM|nr:GGDEF and EAL domain-containing protein [Marinomonas algarum]MCB5161686.1 GGDEF and EAL domain-containing protein [Marinomonas algarum]